MIKYLILDDARFDVPLKSDKYTARQLVVLYKLYELQKLIGPAVDLKALTEMLAHISPNWEEILAEFAPDNPQHIAFKEELVIATQNPSSRSRYDAASIMEALPRTW